MANHAYLGVWLKNFPEERILEEFGKFLRTVPFSKAQPGFTHLVIQAVAASETPVLEQDFRAMPLDSDGIVEIAKDYLHSDSSYEVRAHWDLWGFDSETGRSQLQPQMLDIFCHGEDYDDGFWRDNGHFQIHLGFEHFFTGHAGLLGHRGAPAPPESAEEEQFLTAMAWPENLQAYQEKTRENIGKLFEWVRRIQKAVPVERVHLWSEGEENFEARLEEILAAR